MSESNNIFFARTKRQRLEKFNSRNEQHQQLLEKARTEKPSVTESQKTVSVPQVVNGQGVTSGSRGATIKPKTALLAAHKSSNGKNENTVDVTLCDGSILRCVGQIIPPA